MKTLIHQFRDIICANEGGDSVALRFSDPDGVRSGKSGWSFGVSQFDTQNNGAAVECLVDCGFTQDEIYGIVHQTIDVRPLAVKLIANADIIAQYDEAQLQYCVDVAQKFINNYQIPIANDAALLMLADTVNQYGSLGSGSAKNLLSMQRPVTAEDIVQMKLGWKYSKTKTGRNDTIRRYNNVVQICKE